MRCKVKDCGFISNCPEMMEYHLSSAHCQRTTSSKRKIDQDPQLMKSPPSDTSNSNSSSEPKVQLSHISSPEVTELRPPNQKRPRLKRVTSPEKRPRNIKIGIENVLSLKETHTDNLIMPDNVLMKLLLVKMFQSPNHCWESVCGDDGNIDPRISVTKTLLLDHIGGCEHCQEIVGKEETFKSRFDYRENHSVAFLKNQILCHLKHIDALKEEVRQLQAEIEGLSDKKYDLGHSLPEIPKPRVLKDPFYSKPKGFRLIDTNLMGLALSNAQTCQHTNLTLAENVSKNSQMGLATQLAFICQTCGDQTLFVSSSFNVQAPSNYTVNKLLLQKLGKTAYSTLSRELSSTLGLEPIMHIESQQKPKMFVSYVGDVKENIKENLSTKSNLDLISSNVDPMTTQDCGSHFMSHSSALLTPNSDLHNNQSHLDTDNAVIDQTFKDDENHEYTTINDFLQVKVEEPEALEPLGEPEKNIMSDNENNSDSSSTTSDLNYLLEDSDSNDVNALNNPPAEVPKIKLRDFSELQGDENNKEHSNSNHSLTCWTQAEEPPPEEMFYVMGGVATPVAPGSKVVSNRVRKTTCQKSSLPKGVYLFKKENCQDEILVVKEEPLAEINTSSGPKVPSASSKSKVTAKDLFRDTLKRVNGVSDDMFERFVTTKWNHLDPDRRNFFFTKARKMNETFSNLASSSSDQELWVGNEGLPAGWQRKLDKIGQNKETGRPFLKVRIITPDNMTLHNKSGLKKYLAKTGQEGSISLASIDFSPYRDHSRSDLFWDGDEGLPQGWHRKVRQDMRTQKVFVEIVTPDVVTLCSKAELRKYLKLKGLDFLDENMISFSPYKSNIVHDDDDIQLISKLDECL